VQRPFAPKASPLRSGGSGVDLPAAGEFPAPSSCGAV